MSNVLHLSSTNWNRLDTINSTFSDAIYYLKKNNGHKVRIIESSNPNLDEESACGEISIQVPGMQDNWQKLQMYPGIDLSCLRQTSIDMSEMKNGFRLFKSDYQHFWCQKEDAPKKIHEFKEPKLIVCMGGDVRTTSPFFSNKLPSNKILDLFLQDNKSFVLESASAYSFSGFTHKVCDGDFDHHTLNRHIEELVHRKNNPMNYIQEQKEFNQMLACGKISEYNRANFLRNGLDVLFQLEDLYKTTDNIKVHNGFDGVYFVMNNQFFPESNLELIMHNYVDYHGNRRDVPSLEDLQEISRKFQRNYVVLQDGMSLKVENDNGKITSGILNKLNRDYLIITPEKTIPTKAEWVPVELNINKFYVK